MNTALMNQYKYLAKDGDGALAFNGSVPCYLPNKSNGCYESENGSLMFYGKCVQNGTPSPSSPVAVEYVDGDGRITDETLAGGQTLTMPDIYGIGDIRDTYEPCVWVNGALRSRLTRRIGVVDLGTLDWAYTGISFYSDVPTFPAPKLNNIYRGLCKSLTNYTENSYNGFLSSDNSFLYSWIGTSQHKRFFAKASAYTDTASFKAAMSGVMLYYELANPVITLGDPQPVQSYGGATNIFHTSVVKPKISATVVQHKATPLIYGFHVDSTVSDPSNAVTYLNDAVGMTPAHMDYTNGVFDYGSWADAFFMPRPCMLRSDGTVAYYLNPNDYSQKADGTASDIANEAFDGNAMMEWGQNGKRIYYAIVPDASVDGSYSVYISDTKVNENYNCWSFYDKNNNLMPHFYTPIYSGSLDSNNKLRSLSGKAIMLSKTGTQEMAYAKANGEGWYIEVFADKTLMFLLLYLMGKSLDVQTTFGQGHTRGGGSSAPATPTGQLDNKGLFFGYSSTSNKVKVFGMEDQWGERCKRTAGLMLNNGTIYYKMTAGTADGSTATDYTDGTTTTGMLSGGASLASRGYVTKMRPHDGKMLLASAVGGSATTYYCDYWYQNQSGVRFALLGGDSSNEGWCGFYVNLNNPVSDIRWYIAAALSCKPLIQ